MKIVFLGTPEFAVESLRALGEAGHEILAVVTAPDRPAGRGQQPRQSAVKQFAVSAGYKVLQPENLKDPVFTEELRSLGAEMQVVVAFRMLPEVVWNMPVFGTYNLHASLLPRYRGAAPINRAIMNGEKVTGITTFKLRHAIDSGNILMQEPVEIGEQMDAGALHDELMTRGARLLVRSVEIIARCAERNEEPPFITQDESLVSHAPKIFREDCELDWSRTMDQLYNQVRGLSPFPGAFTFIVAEGKKAEQLKIYRCSKKAGHGGLSNGSLLTDRVSSLVVGCANGALAIEEVQLEGKKRMGVAEFLRGYRFAAGALLKAPAGKA
jgi:methionyl-tRNA formyltransferase